MTTDDTSDQRLDRFSRAISSKTMAGWNVVDRNDKDLVAVLIFPEKPINHVVHVLITIFTCGLWGIVWGAIALLHKGEKRIRLSIDATGTLFEEEIQL